MSETDIPAPEALDTQAPPDAQALDPLAALEAEAEKLKTEIDAIKRAAAEERNRANRIERDAEERVKFAFAGFAKELLGVADSLRRAVEAVPGFLREDGRSKNFIDGVELTEQVLLAAFEKFGIKQIAAQDARFDPNLHQAMFEIEDITKPQGTVMQVMQSGYTLNERLLRPAMVGVSKGGPKANAAQGGLDTSA
ncbi:MAG: nucleotide exchange factor GrpE [Rhodospirillales bacterium]|nr:MAG: nucleotide exchange factor GrpE [Rhodospirillales bacterium]